MKIVFVGPSLPKAQDFAAPDIELRPPACQGDVMRALADGATAIGLIDGQFAMAAPVWHKELLFALSKDIPVFGAASMGALRAAECAAFGMIGIGKIFEDFASGKRVDDADVALTYCPAELGYPALSIPLVNVDATIDKISDLALLSEATCQTLRDAARKIFFKRRNWKSIADLSGIEFEVLKPILARCQVDQKKLDAIALLQVMQRELPLRNVRDWEFNATPLFRQMYL
ncbi:TfuA-like protein [Agrobacterium sp. BA1120]|uniref:TfuA-like protein n=1 Tax=Agrobacterium sp. BA1120 TaxID=3228927 RepID=UPI003369E9C4